MDPVLTDNKLVNFPFDCKKYLEDISDEELGKLSKNKEFFQICITDFLLTIYTKKRPGLLRPHRKKCLEVLHEKETSEEVKYNNLVPPQHGHLLDFTSMKEPAGISTKESFNRRFSLLQERRDRGCSTSDISAQAEDVASAQAVEDTDHPQPDLREASGSSYKQKPRVKCKRSLSSTSSPTTPAGESEDENSLSPKKRHHSC